ncbi:hypothetical protein GGX14DRAFT_570104 [Mycena pura]|uniref:Mid2 domain-containing protein n=1 Tax=Mycena pura TaxID=153505 RepID=A0AAD6Y9E8_9AGAR|nr:hypothetical protein GGX14DRAFT_570104 [Mycena pura]
MAISLLLFLFGTGMIWTTTHAGDPDVFPSDSVVPQCSVLEVVWGQPPPLHLHVQPGSNITAHNLVDLELQTGKSTNFTVALPIGKPRRFLISLIRKLISLFIIGQNFTFAYNTIADQFTVFVSNLMQVGPGTSDCLTGSGDTTTPPPPPPPSNPSSIPMTAPSTTSKNDAPPTTLSKSASSTAGTTSSASNPSSASSASVPSVPSSTSASPVVVPVSTISTGSSSKAATFPVGAVVGSVCALAVVILIALALFLWYWRRQSKRILAYPSTTTMHSEMVQQAPLLLPIRGDITPYRESFATQEHPQMRQCHSASDTVSGSTEPCMTTAEDERRGQGYFSGVSEEQPPPPYDYPPRP